MCTASMIEQMQRFPQRSHICRVAGTIANFITQAREASERDWHSGSCDFLTPCCQIRPSSHALSEGFFRKVVKGKDRSDATVTKEPADTRFLPFAVCDNPTDFYKICFDSDDDYSFHHLDIGIILTEYEGDVLSSSLRLNPAPSLKEIL
ncbi:hypothetical protein G5714_015227 [Onychostoma macrolepis]|uniref:Uncharacterized protein n=1 Tax=Onychostoma macrolepis TaxID=369639 RepID=A0A7J6CAL8_9TELE|nr:hypothetical protein G5714_015227 [Onychostoma macrolepis]